jgi:hypothetical protein
MGPKPALVPLNIHRKIASEVIAAHEAEAQKAHANAVAGADLLDQIEEALDCMEKEGLTEAQALGKLSGS